jgi:hypothetical protein
MIATLLLVAFQGRPDSGLTQQMLDIAEPGAVIFAPEYDMGNLTIRKPVTLIFEGVTSATTESITLDGPGNGAVLIVNGDILEGIKGGGFDALRIEDSHVAKGVLVDGFEYVQVCRTVITTNGQADAMTLRAPGADVCLLDSRVLPRNLGTRDISLLAERVWMTASSDIFGAVDAGQFELMPNDFQLPASDPNSYAFPGAKFQVYVATPGPIVFVYMQLGSRSPTPMPGARFGWDHLGVLDSPTLLAVGRSPGYIQIELSRRNMLGQEVSLQVWDPPGYYSRPLTLTLRR